MSYIGNFQRWFTRLFNRKCFDLHLDWNIEVKDKSGKCLYVKSGKSKSLLRNFMYWLQSFFQIADGNNAGSFTAPDTSNTSRTFNYATLSYQSNHGAFCAPVTISAYGLRVGKLDTAVTAADFEMATLIPHGTATDNLSYGAQTFEVVTVVGTTTSFRVTRPFTNNTGATVTIKEIGAALAMKDTANASRYLCFLRDVLASSVPVPDGSTFTLRYTFSVTA